MSDTEKRLFEVQCNLRGDACIHVEAKSAAEAKRMVRNSSGDQEWGHYDIWPTTITKVVDCGEVNAHD